MDKKAFTLIELLAVIVILGILALIVTPILINVVKDSNEKSYKLSADGYISAVNDYILSNQLDGKKVENGKYNIKNLDVKISGKAPSKGSVEIYDEKINNAQLCYDTYLLKYDGKEVTLTEKGCEKEATVNLAIGKKTYKNTVKDDIETEFNISDDISDMTNIVCNNGATISMNDNTLKLSDVYKDTNCTMSRSINDTFNNLDDTKNYVLMLKKDTIKSKMTVGEKNKVTINLNGQNLTSIGSDSTSAFGISGELSIIGQNSSIAGNMNSAEVTNNGILNIDGGSYNSINPLNNSKISIKNAKLNCTNDGNNCYPIFAQNNSNVELDNVKAESKGKAAGASGNSNMIIKNSNFICTEDNCLYDDSIGKLTVLDTTIKASGYAVKLNNSGEVTIKNTKLESETNNAVKNAGASGKITIENSELISSNYRGVTLDEASSGSIDIYNSRVIGKDYGVLNNSNGGGVININGGTYISNDITIMNINDGKININDKNSKVYIASYKKEGNTGVYKAKAIKNTANGVININGNVSDFCGKDDTKTTIGTCIYNEYGRAIVNDDTATGEIKISGGYIVSNNSSAVENFQGNISICGSKIDGKEADLKINKITTGDYGYIYYDVNTKLMNDTKIDRYNNPSHIVLTADLVCK
jgi:prepilin-type N-terminal cleavage/methylation domain-containing protein